MKRVLGGKAAVIFAACCRTDFDMISVDVVFMLLLLLMIIGFVVYFVVFLMLFVLQEAFVILIKRLLVIIQFFGVFFLLPMICSWLVALLCVQVYVQHSGWLDRVLRYGWFVVHIWVRWLLLLALV